MAQAIPPFPMHSVLILTSLIAMAAWEWLLPSRGPTLPALRRRAGNLALWTINMLAAAALFTMPDQLRAPWPMAAWGGWGSVLAWSCGFLLLDCTNYLVHRGQHAVPWLWRMHALHHSDPDLDWSSAVRSHPLDALVLNGAAWLVVLVAGVPGWIVVHYELCAFMLALATHANVRWPPWAERLGRKGVVTPALHVIHHSIDEQDANANFGAVLAIWDRLAGTFRQAAAHPNIAFGVAGLPPDQACKLLSMLATPWRLKL